MTTIIPYREHHLFTLLEGYSLQTRPIDLYVSEYFRNNPSLGSKDRGFIAETIYVLIRWQGLIDYIGGESSWKKRYEVYQSLDLEALQKREDIPLAIRVSFPQILFDLFSNTYGQEKTVELCLACNSPAPTTVRANSLKITRAELLDKWKELYEVSPAPVSPDGIIFHKKINFFQLPEFKEGLFEVQDEGSQLLSKLMHVQPGDQVLDYCAGSGGKSLAFAPQMDGKGQIYLHDIRSFVLREAKVRMKRAGIQHYQILEPDSPQLSKLKKKMDWVLVDAPCSGTGTLRRNPDMKWKFSAEMLQRLIGQQRMIFEKALSFLKPSGRIVYATCSLLKEENQEQLEHLLSTYSLEIVGAPFQSFPSIGGMDGFFGVVLKRQ